jgi:predicted  nucleic acid-binding Zn-ribbon protein
MRRFVMKKVLLIAVVALFAAVVFAGCNQEEIKKLNDQVAGLTTENQTLKAKVADLEKGKADLAGQLTAANASVEGAKKEAADCKAALEEAMKNQKPVKGAKKADAKKADAKPAAKAEKAPKAPKAKKAK